jgi:hypothetical protein
MRSMFALAVLAACGGAPRTSPAPSTSTAAPAITYGTAVAVLAAGTPVSVLAGPFAVTAINPGSNLLLGLSTTGACDASVVWFSYSGGGVAVGDGETLCARSTVQAPVPHGFSGHD